MTDKKRIEILDKAKELIDSEIHTFICFALEHLIEVETGIHTPLKMVFEIFPELMKHKPKEGDKYHAWFGGVAHKATRIKVLNSMIKEIKK